MSAAAFNAISKLGDIHYVGPVAPPVVLRQKLLSKLLRIAGLRGDFFCFSEHRLRAIADAVQAECNTAADLDYFHGFTPWILIEPQRPYIARSDCTFRDYIDIYHCREHFNAKDIKRIETTEAAWLKKAQQVLFTSEWAARRATHDYALDSSRVRVVGIFGEVDPPLRDTYAGSKQFVFISTNFESKGGRVVLSAFRKLKKLKPDASLVVVGDRPPDVLSENGVNFTGYLRKENPREYARFREILSGALALVHLTRADVSPHVIVEAGYFGCPAIASRRFAIPELVDDGRSGILLDEPENVNAVVGAMLRMLERENYHGLRQAVWAKAHGQHSKAQFEERLLSYVREVVSDMKRVPPV